MNNINSAFKNLSQVWKRDNGQLRPPLRLWRKILAYIPGTYNSLRREYESELKYAKRWTRNFMNLSSIDEESKQRLHPNVRHHIATFSVMLWRWRIRRVRYAAMYGSVMAIPIMLVFLLVAITVTYVSNLSVSLVLFILGLSVMLMYVLIFSRLMKRDEIGFNRAERLVGVFLTAVCAVIFIAYLSSSMTAPPTVITNIIGFVAGGTLLVIMLVFTVVVIPITVNNVLWHMDIVSCADSVIIYRHIGTLYLAEKRRKEWSNIDTRKELVSRIEEIASVLENQLSKQLQCGENTTDTWLATRNKQVSAAFRELKRPLLILKSDSYDIFTKQLADNIALMVTGDWNSLALADVEVTAGLTKWRSRTSSLLKVILVAGMPWLAIWLIQQTSLAIGEPVLEYLKVGAMIWAILSVIASIDPLFSTKVGALKDISSIFPSSDRSGRT